MSPSRINLYGLVTAAAPNPRISYGFGDEYFVHTGMVALTRSQVDLDPVYSMFHNSVAGPHIVFSGRISVGFQSGELQNRPYGRPGPAGGQIVRLSGPDFGRTLSGPCPFRWRRVCFIAGAWALVRRSGPLSPFLSGLRRPARVVAHPHAKNLCGTSRCAPCFSGTRLFTKRPWGGFTRSKNNQTELRP
jgi:hypothetical protein